MSPTHPLVQCIRCHGISTAIRYHPLFQGHICLDEGLCEKIKVYEAMLAKVKSA